MATQGLAVLRGFSIHLYVLLGTLLYIHLPVSCMYLQGSHTHVSLLWLAIKNLNSSQTHKISEVEPSHMYSIKFPRRLSWAVTSEEYCGSDPQVFSSVPRPHTGTVRVYAVLHYSGSS